MVQYLKSSIGRKQIMAVTGLLWSGFVLTHMLGNILIFCGSQTYNAYSYAIIHNPFLYLAEAGLVFTLLAHIINGIKLKIENTCARPQKYAMPTNGEKAARFQSKYMAFHGSMLLVFIISHLITFKYGTHYNTTISVGAGGASVEARDLYRLVVEVFHQPGYLLWYFIGLLGLGFHLSHGFASSFASLGFFHPRYSPLLQRIGYAYSVVVTAGFLAPPVYVYFFA